MKRRGTVTGAMLNDDRGTITRGSLREIALPDVVQELFSGRRTGNLRVVGGGEHGEVEFRDGHVSAARFGSLEGEKAFYQMLGLTDAEYEFDDA